MARTKDTSRKSTGGRMPTYSPKYGELAPKGPIKKTPPAPPPVAAAAAQARNEEKERQIEAKKANIKALDEQIATLKLQKEAEMKELNELRA